LIHTTFAVIYGILGIFTGCLMLVLIDKITKRKCLEKDIIEKKNLFNKKYIKVILCFLNVVAWTMAGLTAENPIGALLLAIIFSLAVMIAVIDIRIHIIPNKLVLTLMVAGVLFQLIQFGGRSLLIAVACMLGITVIFLIVGAIIGLHKIGAGDVKLAGAMGLVLGYPHILTAVLAMSIVLLAYCFIGVYAYKLTMKSMFAYAPFMMLGLVVGLITIAANISIF
jgi:leader peptidase (prepilin peptidase)/N-methyltransferase